MHSLFAIHLNKLRLVLDRSHMGRSAREGEICWPDPMEPERGGVYAGVWSRVTNASKDWTEIAKKML